MKKVVLLGDSIRLIGYGSKVKELLGEDYDVFNPDDNCRFIKYTLRFIFDYYDQIKDADIIHWNNGLWDICRLHDDGLPFTSIEEYVENILRVAKILKNITPNVIFATTTPVRYENIYNRNEDIDHYNEIIIPKLKELGIIINDLGSLLKTDIYKYITDDNIHLSLDGIDVCSKEVIRYIKMFE